MDRDTLDARCAELKARMLTADDRTKESRTLSTQCVPSIQSPPETTDSRSSAAKPTVSKQAVHIRSPHPLVKAALAAMRDVPEGYGKLQFRRQGYLDVRVSKSLARRALAIMDLVIKRAGQSGLRIDLATRERGYYSGFRQYTYITDGREQVQLTVTEKTYQCENPAWTEEKRYSVPRHLYDPSGRLSLILDDESYRCSRKWSDAKGHLVEDYIDEAVSSIGQALEAKWQARVRLEEERRRELERQKIRAEEVRQEREEEQRFEQLNKWADVWKQCEQLRAFLGAWEHKTEAMNGPILPGSPADGWRRWVNGLIDKLDPLVDC